MLSNRNSTAAHSHNNEASNHRSNVRININVALTMCALSPDKMGQLSNDY
jgi:hypothetical protein